VLQGERIFVGQNAETNKHFSSSGSFEVNIFGVFFILYLTR